MHQRPRAELSHASIVVECLACGEVRAATVRRGGGVESDQCPRCGDVGWTRPADLRDAERARLRLGVRR